MIVSVTADRQFLVPSEVQSLLQPGEEYELKLTQEGMIFKKVQPFGNFDRLMEKVDAIGTDADRSSLDEISEMVKSVRQGNLNG
ncbi:MAG: hypothetical protein H7237_00660 [Alkalinema sp. FL-bin-369]|nr:hypothetical protein [Leptolyngbyaceae cyanobacterium LF-bin-369]